MCVVRRKLCHVRFSMQNLLRAVQKSPSLEIETNWFRLSFFFSFGGILLRHYMFSKKIVQKYNAKRRHILQSQTWPDASKRTQTCPDAPRRAQTYPNVPRCRTGATTIGRGWTNILGQTFFLFSQPFYFEDES